MPEEPNTTAHEQQSVRDNITLDFDGPVVTPEMFRRIVSAFVELLISVTDKAAEGGKKTTWDMAVSAGSRLLVARPVADAATRATTARVIKAIPEGLRQIEKVTLVPPKYFDNRALHAAREIAALSDGKLSYVKVQTKSGPITMSRQALRTLDSLLHGQHQALGSVEGKLQTITERGTLQFVVFDSLYDKGVNCFIDEDLVHEAVSAFGKRVIVTGMVQYEQGGRPVSIRVDEIRVLKEPAELPPIKTLRGIFKKAQ